MITRPATCRLPSRMRPIAESLAAVRTRGITAKRPFAFPAGRRVKRPLTRSRNFDSVPDRARYTDTRDY